MVDGPPIPVGSVVGSPEFGVWVQGKNEVDKRLRERINELGVVERRPEAECSLAYFVEFHS